MEIGSGQGTSFPGAIDVDATLEINSPNVGKTKAKAELINDLAAAVIAIQNELGTDPAGTLADVKTWLQTDHNSDATHKFFDNVKYIGQYASFATAISSIGSSTITLLINSVQTVSATVTIPSTLTLWFIGTGQLSINSGVTVTINGPVQAPLKQIFSGASTSPVKFGPGAVRRIHVQWFGAMRDGTLATQTSADFNNAFKSLPSYTSAITDVGAIGGTIVHASNGQYAINDPIIIGTHNNQVIQYCLEGDGEYATYLIWTGGNTNDIIQIGRPDLGNLHGVVVRKLTLLNSATGGSGYLAIRAIGINGIRLNAPGATGQGSNHFLLEEIRFMYSTNGIISTNVAAVNNLTVRKCRFDGIYNQTDPVVNPVSDALVAGRGNAIYLGANADYGGLYLLDNTIVVQGYFVDALGAVGVRNLMMQNNFQDQSFNNSKMLRCTAFNTITIQNNDFTTGSPGPVLDLGTTALGSSGLSGGLISGNNFTSATDAIKVTYGKGLNIFGNSFMDVSGKAIELVGANVSDILLGPNIYTGTLGVPLTNGGALRLINLDTAIASGTATFPYEVAIGTTPADGGILRIPYEGAMNSRNQLNSSNIALIYLGTQGGVTNLIKIGDTGQNGILWNKALVALGGGAAPTLGTIGGSGPATATQNAWMEVYDTTGAKFWVPGWK